MWPKYASRPSDDRAGAYFDDKDYYEVLTG
jgi:hypothetical protein